MAGSNTLGVNKDMKWVHRLDSRELAVSCLKALILLLPVLLLPHASSALTLINDGEDEEFVMVKMGEAVQEVVLKPKGTVSGICMTGCILALEGAEDLDVTGSETVHIEMNGFRVAE
ncbi:MAG: hypothetical protein O2967_15215 [Proteobacteria bacterium]|nr:hypothetical protein [Pseudomonadota bacterium]